MCPVNLTVWFLCKSCKLNFAKVDDFIEHKKENHFTEFQAQNTSCIVFEERIDGDLDHASGSMEEKPIPLKEEFQLSYNSRIELISDSIVSCFADEGLPWKIAELNAQTNEYCCRDSEPIEATLEPKTEIITYESQSQGENASAVDSFQPQHNPYVLVKRLTSKEIHDASSASNRKLNLNKHIKNYNVRGSFKCKQLNCGKVFKFNYHLNAHMKCHSDLRPFSCSQCDKTFKRRDHLTEHVRMHTGERPFKCRVENCGRSFAKSAAFSRHKKEHRIK